MDQAEMLTLRLAALDADDLRHALRHALLSASGTAKAAAKRDNRDTLRAAQIRYRELNTIIQTAELYKKFK